MTAEIVADSGHVMTDGGMIDVVRTTIEETTEDEMITIHVITMVGHVIMTEEIMIDDQMRTMLRRLGKQMANNVNHEIYGP